MLPFKSQSQNMGEFNAEQFYTAQILLDTQWDYQVYIFDSIFSIKI